MSPAEKDGDFLFESPCHGALKSWFRVGGSGSARSGCAEVQGSRDRGSRSSSDFELRVRLSRHVELLKIAAAPIFQDAQLNPLFTEAPICPKPVLLACLKPGNCLEALST